MLVFPEWESSERLVFEQLLIELLSENVAAICENGGWVGWLVVAVSWDVSSVAEEVGDLLRLLKLLSENVAVFSENVAWLGPTGWTGWLAVEDGSGVEKEFVDLGG